MIQAQTLKIAETTTDNRSPVYALLRKISFIDYPGRLSRVLFISGCNLRCSFCHNWDLIKPQKSTIDWGRLEQMLLQSRENWVDAVCITGGEPTLNPKLEELVNWIKDLGFKVKLDTNGSRPSVLKKLLPLVDYVAMDYKAPIDKYLNITGCPFLELGQVRESVRMLLNWGGDYEFRTTVVEGIHEEEDLLTMCSELKGAKRFVLQGYVPVESLVERYGSLPKTRTPRKLLRQYHKRCRDYFPEVVLRGE